jgi:hypothetical protein
MSAVNVCKVCGVQGPQDVFNGRELKCKTCARAEARERMAKRRATPEGRAAARAAVARWKKANPEKVRLGRVAELEKHRAGRPSQEARRMAAAVQQALKQAQRAEQKQRQEQEKAARWAQLGITEDMSPSQRWAARYKSDPAVNLRERLRAAMRKQAKKFGWVNSYFGQEARRQGHGKIWVAVGYTASKLRSHLELQFTDGMTWERFMAGEIHVDHIVPKSQFNLDSEADLRACYALSNLRPLWASQNLRKGPHRVELC